MEFWNQKNLLPPPIFTFKAENQNVDLLKLRNTLQDAIEHFRDQDILQREAVLLNRITYRMKMKFRSAKDFKSLEKISHAIDRYFKCNIVPYLKLLVTLAPREYYHDDIYLPTKNMFYYILVKLQGLAKLMERIHDSCKIAAFLTSRRMSVGHFWKLSIIVFALISRIYVLVKFNCQFICDLYAKLYSHSVHLKNPGADWLPKDYELPVDLRQWLGVQWVYEEEFVDLTAAELSQPIDFLDLCIEDDEDDIEVLDEYVLIDEDDELNDFRKLKQKKLEKSRHFEDRSIKKQKKDKYQRNKKQTMRGFLDADCGEVIQIEDSFIDKTKANNIQEVDNAQLEIIKNYHEFQQASKNREEDVLDEYSFNDDGIENDDDENFLALESKDKVEENNAELNTERNLQEDIITIHDSITQHLPHTIVESANLSENSNIILISDTTINNETFSNEKENSKTVKKQKIKTKIFKAKKNSDKKKKAIQQEPVPIIENSSKKRSFNEVFSDSTQNIRVKKLKRDRDLISSTPISKTAYLSKDLFNVSAVLPNKDTPKPGKKKKVGKKKDKDKNTYNDAKENIEKTKRKKKKLSDSVSLKSLRGNKKVKKAAKSNDKRNKSNISSSLKNVFNTYFDQEENPTLMVNSNKKVKKTTKANERKSKSNSSNSSKNVLNSYSDQEENTILKVNGRAKRSNRKKLNMSNSISLKKLAGPVHDQQKPEASLGKKKIKKRKDKSDIDLKHNLGTEVISSRNNESNSNATLISKKRKGHFANEKENLKKKKRKVSKIECIDISD